MSPSLTTSRASRLRKRSTRSSGASVRTARTFCCRPTVRTHGSVVALRVRARQHSGARNGVVRAAAGPTTDKTIKLWKVYEKQLKVVTMSNMSNPEPVTNVSQLRLPKLQNHNKVYAHVPRRVYANAHAYHINSISLNTDGETFISADDLRINLWNLDISDQSFSMCTRRPRRGGKEAPLASPGAAELTAWRVCKKYCLGGGVAAIRRHCGHQAAQHGGADRGCDGHRVPPEPLQPVCLQQ